MPENPSYTTAVRARILIIDDEESIRESLEALLTFERFAVETAPDAASGLELLGRKGYDLILLDLMLPDRSGLEVLEEVRQFDSETPILMLTAFGTVESAVKAIRLGADDFFPILLYTVIHAQLERPFTMIHLMNCFAPMSIRNSEVGYCMTSLEAAVVHCSNLSLNE